MTTNPTFRPFRPVSRLSGDHARAINTLARHAGQFTLELGNPARQWHATLTATTTAAPPRADDMLVQLDWYGARLSLQVPERSLKIWMETQLPDLQFADLTAELRAAALDIWLQQLLNARQRSLAGDAPPSTSTAPAESMSSPRVISATSGADHNAVPLPFAWNITLRTEGAPRTPVVLRADHAALELLAQAAISLPARTATAHLGALDVDVTVLIGGTTLSVAELHRLERGDVVLLDEYRVDTDGQLWLCAGPSAGVRIRADGGRYIVTQGWTPLMTESTSDPQSLSTSSGVETPDTLNEASAEERGQSETQDSAQDATAHTDPAGQSGAHEDANASGTTADAPDAPVGLDDINIQLSFDLGHRRLPLAELQALQPGAVFDLARPLNDGPVHIRANGTLIGYGELVDIDGRVGVQISRMGAKP